MDTFILKLSNFSKILPNKLLLTVTCHGVIGLYFTSLISISLQSSLYRSLLNYNITALHHPRTRIECT